MDMRDGRIKPENLIPPADRGPVFVQYERIRMGSLDLRIEGFLDGMLVLGHAEGHTDKPSLGLTYSVDQRLVIKGVQFRVHDFHDGYVVVRGDVDGQQLAAPANRSERRRLERTHGIKLEPPLPPNLGSNGHAP